MFPRRCCKRDCHSRMLLVIVGVSMFSYWFLSSRSKFWNYASHNQPVVMEISKIPAQKVPYRDEVTVVTAYFSIGSFVKGRNRFLYTPNLYRTWMKVFSRIQSPVIAYFDNMDDLQLFRQIRDNLPLNMTVATLVNRDKMWSFALEPAIAEIYARPGYPKHYPNTVVSLYSAAMHAKYEVMHWAAMENPFRTRYICWLDVGLFRDLEPELPNFSLYLPEDFQRNSVAYQQVHDRDAAASTKEIIGKNLYWVCGCFFIGSVRTIFLWTAEYRAAVERLVNVDKLISTDQQVIYIMFNWAQRPRTKLQTYTGKDWFDLGYRARDAGLARMKGLRDSMLFGNVSNTITTANNTTF